MKINKVDHISVAVKNLDQARRIWEPVLGKTGPDDAYIHPKKMNGVLLELIDDKGAEFKK